MAVAGTPPVKGCLPSPCSREARSRTWKSVVPFSTKFASASKPVRAGSPLRCATFRTAKCWRNLEEIGNRCIECGGCTYVCPACTCFTVSDRQASANEVERVRIWDSCALGVLRVWQADTIRARPYMIAAIAGFSANWRTIHPT